jgi:hypothetical protein
LDTPQKLQLPVAAQEFPTMKRTDAKSDLEVRAAAALKAVLGEVSTIKVKEIRRESPEQGLTAYVDIFGRRHTLTCDVQADGQPGHVRSALEELCNCAAHRTGDAMPVIIAPYLSPEAQALCKEHKAGFLDLEGNARLSLGEVFIVKRTLPNRSAAWPATPNTAGKFPAVSAHSSSRAHRAEA